MTSNKCEHWSAKSFAFVGGEAQITCPACGQRFVPFDVLEECAETIRELMLHPNGAYDECARGTLARIDAVLGKKP